MTEPYSLQQIRNYWIQQAEKYEQSPKASWSDHMVIEMEIREIDKHLSTGDQVLDVGCASGISSDFDCNVTGIDPSFELLKLNPSRNKVQAEAENIGDRVYRAHHPAIHGAAHRHQQPVAL